jgi:hypothetical protein
VFKRLGGVPVACSGARLVCGWMSPGSITPPGEVRQQGAKHMSNAQALAEKARRRCPIQICRILASIVSTTSSM